VAHAVNSLVVFLTALMGLIAVGGVFAISVSWALFIYRRHEMSPNSRSYRLTVLRADFFTYVSLLLACFLLAVLFHKM
jgi:hypothetical protein